MRVSPSQDLRQVSRLQTLQSELQPVLAGPPSSPRRPERLSDGAQGEPVGSALKQAAGGFHADAGFCHRWGPPPGPSCSHSASLRTPARDVPGTRVVALLLVTVPTGQASEKLGCKLISGAGVKVGPEAQVCAFETKSCEQISAAQAADSRPGSAASRASERAVGGKEQARGGRGRAEGPCLQPQEHLRRRSPTPFPTSRALLPRGPEPEPPELCPNSSPQTR